MKMGTKAMGTKAAVNQMRRQTASSGHSSTTPPLQKPLKNMAAATKAYMARGPKGKA